MASKIYAQEEISLQDDTVVTLKPLPLGRLRRFMEAWDKIQEIPEGDDGYDVFINCSGIALEENFKGKFDALKATPDEKENGEFLNPDYKEYLYDTLDLDTIYRILLVCAQIDYPKLMEKAMRAQEKAMERLLENQA